jgi:hypothetical protein
LFLKRSRFRAIILSLSVFLTISAFFVFPNFFVTESSTSSEQPYFGISFNGGTVAEAKMLIDKTKDCTNLFVLQSGPISKNETAINLICDYAVDAGLDFIVFFGWFDTEQPWQIPWLDFAKERWGDDFLGVYLYDEPGGIQLDYNWSQVFHRIKERFPEFYESISVYVEYNSTQIVLRDYDEAANRFYEYVQDHLQINELSNRSIASFTADYGLYWFDYAAGYDTVFVELGWDHDSAKHIGLGRGAARVQQKDWGSIIVWNDVDPENERHEGDYKSGDEMLVDMFDSYNAGADFIIIFNYPVDPPGNPYGILTEEHFDAIEQFWDYMQENPDDHGMLKAEAVLVLPRNYAWGLRRVDDRIWGYWGPDEKSEQVWEALQHLLFEYDGFSLDIVYEDSAFPVEGLYEQVYYWNYTG